MEHIFWYTVYMTGTLFFAVISMHLVAFILGSVMEIIGE
jgi:hypothetical protein